MKRRNYSVFNFTPANPGRRSKTDANPRTVYLTPVAMAHLDAVRPEEADSSGPVLGLSVASLSRRVKAAAKAAGLGAGYIGHSGLFGMAQCRHGRRLHPGRKRGAGRKVGGVGRRRFLTITLPLHELGEERVAGEDAAGEPRVGHRQVSHRGLSSCRNGLNQCSTGLGWNHWRPQNATAGVHLSESRPDALLPALTGFPRPGCVR